MAVEQLSYAALAERLKITPEAARSLAKRHRWLRSRANDGKTLVSIDLAEIEHKPLPGRSPGGHRPVVAELKAKLEAAQAEIVNLAAMAAGHRAALGAAWMAVEQISYAALHVTGKRRRGPVSVLCGPRSSA